MAVAQSTFRCKHPPLWAREVKVRGNHVTATSLLSLHLFAWRAAGMPPFDENSQVEIDLECWKGETA